MLVIDHVDTRFGRSMVGQSAYAACVYIVTLYGSMLPIESMAFQEAAVRKLHAPFADPRPRFSRLSGASRLARVDLIASAALASSYPQQASSCDKQSKGLVYQASEAFNNTVSLLTGPPWSLYQQRCLLRWSSFQPVRGGRMIFRSPFLLRWKYCSLCFLSSRGRKTQR
jgi:hypothetical protein